MDITVTKNLSPESLREYGVEKWPVWEKDVSEFNWHYDAKETCYIIEGRAQITYGDEMKEIAAGDLVVFPKGLACTWNITEPLKKHYTFG